MTSVHSLIDDDHILIHSRNQPLELYHLLNDPLQQHNLAEQSSERARLERMQKTLDAIRSSLDKSIERVPLFHWAM